MATDRRRIGFLSYTLPGDAGGFGGTSVAAHELAQGLALRGHEVVGWSHSPPPHDARYEVRTLPLRGLKGWRAGRFALEGYLGNVLPLLVPLDGIDVLFCHGDSVLTPLLRVPAVRIFYGSAYDEAQSATSLLRRVAQLGIYRLERLSARTGRTSVAISQNTIDRLPGAPRVIPLGIDLGRFRPDPPAKTTHPSALFVGTFHGRKRGWKAVEVVKALRARVPNLTLDFVGHLPEPVEGVVGHGRVDDATLVRLYQRSWLLLAPTAYEGFGLPYVEAMACGTAVVALPNVGSREVTENGAWARLASDDEFEAAAEELLENDGLRARWVAKGLERAGCYDRERMLDGYEAVIEEALRR
jgi:phosphatidylinositol alpha-mannosyltransferase